MLNRRQFVGGVAASSGLLVPSARAQAQKITVTSYGGVWETAIRDTFVADFTKRTGVQAAIQLGNPNQWVSQVEASPAKPPVDVIVSSVDLAVEAGRKGLVEKVAADKLSNLPDIPAQFVDMCQGWGVCFDYGAAGLAYHKGRIKNSAESIKEFVDRTAKGEWTASLPTPSFQPAMQALLWSFNDVYGGKLDDIGPALEAIKRMRKNTIFWSSVTDFLNHLASGEADIGVYYDGRVWAHYDTGATWIDFINPSEGAVMTAIAALKAKNAPPIAWEYINSMLAPEPQAAFAERLYFGMTNTKTRYSDKVKDKITPWEKTRVPPVNEMGKYVSGWVERWNKEIGA